MSAGRTVLRGGALSLRTPTRALVAGLAVALAALALAVWQLGYGDFPMTPLDVVKVLLGDGSPAQRFIVTELRLPRVAVAVLVGIALGLAGAVFQSVTRNPLGSPDVVGFGYGSATGALVAIVLADAGALGTSLGAAAGGVLAGLAVWLLAWRCGSHGYRIVLVGIGIAAALNSVNNYLLTRAEFVDATRATVWLTGSLNGRDAAHVWPLLAAVLVLAPVVLLGGRALRALELGDDAAQALGVRADHTRLVQLGAAVLLTAAATAAAGPISFVALTAPQLARRITGAPGPNTLPAAGVGAVLVLAADGVAQHAFGDTQLPVGVLTGVLGGVYLVWLLYRQRRAGRV
ncbi:ABC transporter permease [Catellatospora sp. TT07R-123]|uniref:FecCD family ABC transporter permease n=1 Tax=Catellatospora sp. TT07R-123 TaxID=2733863 RepID=UPI001B24BCA0|nr:iron chelate uptake ABC transporter family permease subunit [Catellatospora sp. TT07R-123]GHJ47825.1 ABC transporter permease [Catellatospora sp. TT07R-123]